MAEAIRHGTMDARDDRHFTWTAMHYDEIAWSSMVESADALFRRSLEIQAESRGRIAKSGEKPIPVTVAFACFESPRESHKSSIPRLEEFRRARLTESA